MANAAKTYEPKQLDNSKAIDQHYNGFAISTRKKLSQLVAMEARLSYHVLIGTITGLECVVLGRHLNDEISKLRLRLTMQNQEQKVTERQLREEGTAYV